MGGKATADNGTNSDRITRIDRIGTTNNRRAIGEAGISAAGLCLFALFAHSPFPLTIFSFIGLLAAACAIHLSLRQAPSAAHLLGFSFAGRRAAAWLVIGCVLGAALAALYRWKLGWGFLPSHLAGFAPAAAAIGAAEEVVYRGYVQSRLSRLGRFGAIVGASFAHTAYKCALFALPPYAAQTDLVFLAACTFLGGLAFGALREFARSVIPPLAAHAVFDIMVYGGMAHAPEWTWS